MSEVTVSNVTDEAGAIVALTERVRELTEQLNNAQWAHAVDIAKLGAALHEESKRREWCSEYDIFLNSVNEDLTIKLPLRPQSFEFSVEQEITLVVRRYVQVDGYDEEESIEELRQTIESENKDPNGNYSVYWTNDEVLAAFGNMKSDIRWRYDESQHKFGELTISGS